MDHSMSYGGGGGGGGGRQTTPGRSSRQTTPALSGGSLTPNAYNPSVPSIHRVAPSGTHTHTIILLHGRNSSGDEFESELFMGLSSQKLTLEEHFPSWKWVFPSSPERFSTAFQEHLEQWFDLYSLADPSKDEDLQKEGLQASCDFIRGVVEAECREVPPERIVLGGISMGAATAIHALLLGGRRLGGFVGFCSWCPLSRQLQSVQQHLLKDGQQQQQQMREKIVMEYLSEFYKSELELEVGPGTIPPEARYGSMSPPASAASTAGAGLPRKYAGEPGKGTMDIALETPVFLSHSVDDEVVHIEHGREFRDTLETLGMEVTWREYGSLQGQYDDDSDEEEHGEHWIREPDGFDDLVDFLERVEREAYLGRDVLPPTPIPSTPKQSHIPAYSQPSSASQQPTPTPTPGCGSSSASRLPPEPLTPTSPARRPPPPPPPSGFTAEGHDQNLMQMYSGDHANMNLNAGMNSGTTAPTRSAPVTGMLLPQNHGSGAGHVRQSIERYPRRSLSGIVEYGEPIDDHDTLSEFHHHRNNTTVQQRQQESLLSRPRGLSSSTTAAAIRAADDDAAAQHHRMSIEESTAHDFASPSSSSFSSTTNAAKTNLFSPATTTVTAPAVTTAPADAGRSSRKDILGLSTSSSSASSSFR